MPGKSNTGFHKVNPDQLPTIEECDLELAKPLTRTEQNYWLDLRWEAQTIAEMGETTSTDPTGSW